MPDPNNTPDLKEFLVQLYSCLEDENNAKQIEVDQSLKIAEQILHERGDILEDQKRMINVMAAHQISGSMSKVEVPLWYTRDQQVHYDNHMVDQIQEKTSSTSTVFQKIPQGFLRISTNVLKNDGSRAINTYIPSYSPVVKTVEQGKTYQGIAFVVNDWYSAAYKPIFIDGKVKGMFYVGVKESLTQIEDHYLNKEHGDIINILSQLFDDNHNDSGSVISELIHLLYTQETKPQSNHILTLGLKQLIILFIQARGKSGHLTQHKDYLLGDRLTFIGQYIRLNLTGNLTIENLAKKIHMSQPNFFRVFKNHYGQTPMEFINRERIQKACELLKIPEKSVTDVCFDVGYNNVSYFIKQFKIYYGFTPNQFKKEMC
ncbi:helix-turn-helix domain-containing protein [Fulvivirga sp. M361]|uniref:Cache 3/Cache 2 fusion domain-containing protein n=1 Tax=Fulvivirga sp. M361 TaxID=2594266 RepID=UPI00117B6AD5|nr:Cache 3/Cache 2 fusion domain-containing protein [Fulvivirga sp. M361]TRX50651.1 helix-turn-helix domain-containing protein [Fulvivirga sp. M361]